MVAEKRSILRSLGTSFKIVFILSVKPILSISSASSNTTLDTVLRDTAFRCIKSINRPGVATTMCTPRLIDRICVSIDAPP